MKLKKLELKEAIKGNNFAKLGKHIENIPGVYFLFDDELKNDK